MNLDTYLRDQFFARFLFHDFNLDLAHLLFQIFHGLFCSLKCVMHWFEHIVLIFETLSPKYVMLLPL